MSTGLDAVEFFAADGLDLVVRRGSVRSPFAGAAPFYVLAESVGPRGADLLDELAAAIEPVDGVRDAAVATSEADRARLWALREGQTDALAPLRPVKLDVAVPVPALARLPRTAA